VAVPHLSPRPRLPGPPLTPPRRRRRRRLAGPVTGIAAGFGWKSFETISQISLRNQIFVAMDWVRAKVFGRDTSRF